MQIAQQHHLPNCFWVILSQVPIWREGGKQRTCLIMQLSVTNTGKNSTKIWIAVTLLATEIALNRVNRIDY